MIEGKLVGEVDYVYLRPPKRMGDLPAAEKVVLAYERPGNYRGEGTCVLFVDGHVEWMPMLAFKKALKQSADILKGKSGAGTEEF